MLSLSAFQASSESYSYPLSGAEQVEKMKPRIFWHSPGDSRLVSGQDQMGSLVS